MTLRVVAAGQTWTFDDPRVVSVGRGRACDVVLDRPSVSRLHLELRPGASGWQVVDAGSTAGTWVGDRRVQSLPLSGPTTVRVGDNTTGVDISLSVEASAPSYGPPGGAPRPPQSRFAPGGQDSAPPPPPARAPAPPTAVGPAVPPPPMAPPVGPPPPRPVAPAASLPPADLDVTRVPVPGAPIGPTGIPQGPGLMIRTNVATLRFPAGRLVRIGRDPELEMVADDSSVSRQHALVEPRPDGWWFRDCSTGGSYDEDGDRITQRRISEPTTIMLGHPTAGFEIEVVPEVDARTAQRGIAKKRRRRGALIGAGIVALLLVVGGGVGLGFALGHHDTPAPTAADTGLSKANLERAKQASVFVIGESASGEPEYTGSGSIISDTGLILTAGHVGDPQAPGLHIAESNPAKLLIALTSPQDDKPVQAAFQAQPIVTDGVLDLSVLQITSDAHGNPISKADLASRLPTPVPLGNSNDLSTGDDITALGFPALASLESSDQLSPTLTVTKGVAATFEPSTTLNTDRAWIDSDVRIGSGNSGGASINDQGELIGVNDAVITATTAQGHAGEFTGGSALIRPVNLARKIIAIAKKGGDPSYVSPYLDSSSQQSQGATVTADGWIDNRNGGCATPSGQPSFTVGIGDTLYAMFAISGMADGTAVTFSFHDGQGHVLGTTTQPWSFGASQTCVGVPYDVKKKVDPVYAEVTVGGNQLALSPVRLRFR